MTDTHTDAQADVVSASLISADEAATPQSGPEILPERVAGPNRRGHLPPLPESAYGPDATSLELSTHTDAQAAALDEAIKAARTAACEHIYEDGLPGPCIPCRIRAAAPIIAAHAVQQAEEALATIAPANLMTALAKAEAERDELFDAIQGWHVRAAALRARLAAAEQSRATRDEVAARAIRAAEDRVAELEAERDELQAALDLQWNASRRATKRWQDAHPGNDLVWPDAANLMVWLMDRLADAERDALNRAADELSQWANAVAGDATRWQVFQLIAPWLRERATAAGAAQAEPGEER